MAVAVKNFGRSVIIGGTYVGLKSANKRMVL